MASQNNLHIPEELFVKAEQLAAAQGRTPDELAADALKRYIAHEQLEELSRFGQERAKHMGLDQLSEEEREAYIDRVIREARQGRNG